MEMLWNTSMLDVRTSLRIQWVSERLWVHRVSLEPVLSGCVNYSEILFIQIPQQQKDCIQGVRLKVNTVFNTSSVSESGKTETLILLVVVQHNIVSCRKVPFLEEVCALSLMERTEMRTSLWRGASCPAPLVICYVKGKWFEWVFLHFTANVCLQNVLCLFHVVVQRVILHFCILNSVRGSLFW